MKTTLFAVAAGLIAMSASAASALPRATPGLHGDTISTPVVHRDRDGNDNFHMRNRHRGHRMQYDYSSNDNDRYEQYRGWHRYGYRPRRWSDRGCVAAGPIWFCP